jgi:hypothetical protein
MINDFHARIYKWGDGRRAAERSGIPSPLGIPGDLLIINGLRFCIYKYWLMAKDFQVCIYN